MDELIERLYSLPKQPITCQGGIFPWPHLVRGDDGELFRPLVPLWLETESGLVHTNGMLPPTKDRCRASLKTLGDLVDKYLQPPSLMEASYAAITRPSPDQCDTFIAMSHNAISVRIERGSA